MPLSMRPVDSIEEKEIHRSLIARIFPGRSVFEEGLKRGGRVDYIASFRGEPVGIGSIVYGDLGERGDTEIFDIGVAPEHRNAGYGRRILMRLCAEACRARPHQDRVIAPHAVNAPFYAMFGFVPEGEALGDDEGPRVRMRQSGAENAPPSPVLELS